MDTVIHIKSTPRRDEYDVYLLKYIAVFFYIFGILLPDIIIIVYKDLNIVLSADWKFYENIDFVLFMISITLMRFLLMYMAFYIIVGAGNKFNIVRFILFIILLAASIVLIFPFRLFVMKLILSFYKTSMIIIFLINLWSFCQIIIICMDNFFNIPDYKLLKIFVRKIDLTSHFRGNWRFGLVDFFYILCLLIIIVFIIGTFLISVIVICKSYSPLVQQLGSLMERFRFAFNKINERRDFMLYRLMRARLIRIDNALEERRIRERYMLIIANNL